MRQPPSKHQVLGLRIQLSPKNLLPQSRQVKPNGKAQSPLAFSRRCSVSRIKARWPKPKPCERLFQSARSSGRDQSTRRPKISSIASSKPADSGPLRPWSKRFSTAPSCARLPDADDEAKDDIVNAARIFLNEVLVTKARRSDADRNA